MSNQEQVHSMLNWQTAGGRKLLLQALLGVALATVFFFFIPSAETEAAGPRLSVNCNNIPQEFKSRATVRWTKDGVTILTETVECKKNGNDSKKLNPPSNANDFLYTLEKVRQSTAAVEDSCVLFDDTIPDGNPPNIEGFCSFGPDGSAETQVATPCVPPEKKLPRGCAVGGIALDGDLGGLSLKTPDSSGSSVGFFAGIAGAAAGAVALGGAGWYARRRWVR